MAQAQQATPIWEQTPPQGAGVFVVTTRLDTSKALVNVAGELDLSTVAELEESLSPYLDRVDSFIFDLELVSFIDIVGFKPILRECEQGRGRIKSLSEPAARLFDLVTGSGRFDTRGWLAPSGESFV